MPGPHTLPQTFKRAETLPRLVCKCQEREHVEKAFDLAHRCGGPVYPAYSTNAAQRLAPAATSVFIDMSTTAFEHACLEAEFAAAVVVDVSQFSFQAFDESQRVAFIGPGSTYRAFMTECNRSGRTPTLMDASDVLDLERTLLEVVLASPSCGARLQVMSPLADLSWIGLDGDPQIVNSLMEGGPDKRVITCIEVKLRA